METRMSPLHRVLGIRPLSKSAYVLRVERGDLKFRAGQCINIGLPGAGVNREYSTYSAENDPCLEFLIKEVEGGLVSVALKKLKAGDLIELHGAYGDFCLKNPPEFSRPHCFIASGTGIAPFHSFVKSYPGLDYTVLHGVRGAEEAYDRVDYEPARYVACSSRNPDGDFHGRVTDYLRVNPSRNYDTIYYLCGNRAMIGEVYDLLRLQGVPGNHIFTEAFF